MDATTHMELVVLVSAIAAAVSAMSALLTFLFSRKRSRRDRVDILKIEILEKVSHVEGRDLWIKTMSLSAMRVGGGPRFDDIAKFLGAKYARKKWVRLIPVALEELKRDGYSRLLGF